MWANRSKRRFLLALSLRVLLGISSAATAHGLGNGGVNVLTWHNDTYRTGENLSESVLTYNTISKNTFGQLCSQQLDGQVYSQPLAVTNVTIGGTNYPYVVYVVTENDTLYAMDWSPTAYR